jgi:hypothetical protein
MTNPIMTVKSFAPDTLYNPMTDKVIFDRLQENRLKLTQARFAFIRDPDATGGWQQIVRQSQILWCRLTIDFHTIDVQSLGEPPSETEAEMLFKLEAWDFNGRTWGSANPSSSRTRM